MSAPNDRAPNAHTYLYVYLCVSASFFSLSVMIDFVLVGLLKSSSKLL